MSGPLAFEAKNVAKYFGDVKALDGISLEAPQAKIFGLLGPNGAGKTTLVNVLSTLLVPDEGSAKVLGVDVRKDPAEVRRLIGLAGQFAAVDEFLTGRENMHMIGRLYHLSARQTKQRTKDILDKLHLSDAADRMVRTYSGGMRRRLDVGASLVGQPKILYLDEPTTGLDPATRLDLWQIIRDLVHEGTSILLTTQYMEEADELADQIAVIDKGKVIAEGTSDQLKKRLGGDVIEFQLESADHKEKALAAVHSIGSKAPSYDESTRTISLPVKDGGKLLALVVRALDSAKIDPVSLSMHRPSLDDVFLALTGKKTELFIAPSARPKSRSDK